MSLPDWQYIVIHHAAVKDSAGVDAEFYRRFHMDSKGWRDIGYHFIIEAIAGTDQILIGRPLTLFGSHANAPAPVGGGSYNRIAIGICFAGNFTLAPPPLEMLEVAASRIIVPLMQIFGIPKANVIGHRDTGASTECPGRAFVLGDLKALL